MIFLAVIISLVVSAILLHYLRYIAMIIFFGITFISLGIDNPSKYIAAFIIPAMLMSIYFM